MPLIKTLTKGAAALLFAALMVSAPALAAPGSTEQSLVKIDAKLGALVADSVLSSIGLSFAGFESDRVFSRQARRDDDHGDRGSRRGRSGGDHRSRRHDRSGDRSDHHDGAGDRRSDHHDRGDHGSDRHDRSDHRSDHHDGAGDHRSDRHDRGDHRSDRRDHRSDDRDHGDRHADRRDDHHDRRSSHRRHRSDDRHYSSGGSSHYAGRSHGGGHQSYGFSHGHGPHRGHGYYCNTHFAFHYFSGYDPVGWYFAFHDGYSPPYGCRTVERIDYRRGRRVVYGAVQCYDDYGYPYIVRGSQYAYRTY